MIQLRDIWPISSRPKHRDQNFKNIFSLNQVIFSEFMKLVTEIEDHYLMYNNLMRIVIVALVLNNIARTQSTFIESSSDAGIQHIHTGFAYGGGVACGDFDNNGWLDIFITAGKDSENRMYMNTGNGRFELKNIPSLAARDSEGFGAICGDVDNDGDLDIYVTNYFQPNALYINHGDLNFEDVAAAAGVDDDGPSTSAAFVDYDGDGYLDIYVLNRSQTLQSYSSRMYRSNGNITFKDVTAESNSGFVGKSLGVGFFDFDNDHDLDLYVANETDIDGFYKNNGDLTFENFIHDLERPIGEGGGMGVDFADYDNDGDLDIYVSNYDEDFLIKNNNDGTFNEVSASAGIVNIGVGWGVNFFDCDNDGDKDLYVVNGELFNRLKARPNKFYLNLGNGQFREMAAQLGLADQGNGRASVCADFNNDGYEDLFMVNDRRGQSKLFMNPGGINNWITLRLVGTESNRSAIGARVEVVAGDLKQIDEVRAGSSYASMHSLDLEFGLGKKTRIDAITIFWPSGNIQVIENVDVNQILTITEEANLASMAADEATVVMKPQTVGLLQNYPNPFNPETTILYQLPEGGEVQLKVLNIHGQSVREIYVIQANGGTFEHKWDGRLENGLSAPSGVYILHLAFRAQSGYSYTRSRKMMIVR